MFGSKKKETVNIVNLINQINSLINQNKIDEAIKLYPDLKEKFDALPENEKPKSAASYFEIDRILINSLKLKEAEVLIKKNLPEKSKEILDSALLFKDYIKNPNYIKFFDENYNKINNLQGSYSKISKINDVITRINKNISRTPLHILEKEYKDLLDSYYKVLPSLDEPVKLEVHKSIDEIFKKIQLRLQAIEERKKLQEQKIIEKQKLLEQKELEKEKKEAEKPEITPEEIKIKKIEVEPTELERSLKEQFKKEIQEKPKLEFPKFEKEIKVKEPIIIKEIKIEEPKIIKEIESSIIIPKEESQIKTVILGEFNKEVEEEAKKFREKEKQEVKKEIQPKLEFPEFKPKESKEETVKPELKIKTKEEPEILKQLREHIKEQEEKRLTKKPMIFEKQILPTKPIEEQIKEILEPSEPEQGDIELQKQQEIEQKRLEREEKLRLKEEKRIERERLLQEERERKEIERINRERLREIEEIPQEPMPQIYTDEEIEKTIKLQKVKEDLSIEQRALVEERQTKIPIIKIIRPIEIGGTGIFVREIPEQIPEIGPQIKEQIEELRHKFFQENPSLEKELKRIKTEKDLMNELKHLIKINEYEKATEMSQIIFKNE